MATIVALMQLTRLVIFIVAPLRIECSAVPSSDWEVRHSCLSAYFIAADMARDVPNIYDDTLYSLPDDNPAAPRKPRMLGSPSFSPSWPCAAPIGHALRSQ